MRITLAHLCPICYEKSSTTAASLSPAVCFVYFVSCPTLGAPSIQKAAQVVYDAKKTIEHSVEQVTKLNYEIDDLGRDVAKLIAPVSQHISTAKTMSRQLSASYA